MRIYLLLWCFSQAFKPGDVDLSAAASLAAATTTDDTRFFGAVQEEVEFPELADTAYAQRYIDLLSCGHVDLFVFILPINCLICWVWALVLGELMICLLRQMVVIFGSLICCILSIAVTVSIFTNILS